MHCWQSSPLDKCLPSLRTHRGPRQSRLLPQEFQIPHVVSYLTATGAVAAAQVEVLLQILDLALHQRLLHNKIPGVLSSEFLQLAHVMHS